LHYRSGELGGLDTAALVCARFGAHIEVVLMMLAGLTAGRAGRRAVQRCLVAVGTIYFLADLLGSLVSRTRPFAAAQQAGTPVQHGPERSFPSRHVASATAMAVITRPAAPRLAALMGLECAALGLARVRVGLHYPTDVLAGCLLGAAVGRLLR
jgi:undecaprenyl-diphosphatase